MKKVKEIKGYENVKDFYYVNKNGDILSVWSGELKVIKQTPKTGGYYTVCLKCEDNKKVYPKVHRLVALAFIPNPSNKSYVNHIDEDRKNNTLSNLEWVTPQENNDYSLLKKVYCYDLSGNLMKTYDSTFDVIQDGFNRGHVAACARGEERTHKKHIFSYNSLTKNEVVQRLSKTFYQAGKRYKQLYKTSE